MNALFSERTELLRPVDTCQLHLKCKTAMQHSGEVTLPEFKLQSVRSIQIQVSTYLLLNIAVRRLTLRLLARILEVLETLEISLLILSVIPATYEN